MLNLGGRAAYRGVVSPTMRTRGEADLRAVAHHSQLGTVTNSSVSGSSPMPSGYEPAVQLVLPYFGLFAYSVGRQRWVVDASKVLLIRPGWEFADEQPVPGLGHASLLVDPAESIVEEILGFRFSRTASHVSFGAAHGSADIWLLTQYFLAESDQGLTPLQADEWLIRVMELAAHRPRTRLQPSNRTVARAKEYLHAHGCERVPLDRIARAVGVSPVYLTNEFARSEGVPLYQYQLNLRLIRSLRLLHDCDDITQLALELGFSSHSHFGATFRRTFGLAPSAFRQNVRSRRSLISTASSGRSERVRRRFC
ncbi:MAG TPA: AraC family transcriptional regulator [Sphingomicrobium sp.]